jgi:malate dehydrogenase
VPRVAKRGAEIISVRGSSSAASAANAAISHVHDLVHGTANEWTSAAVLSHGEYGVPAGCTPRHPSRATARLSASWKGSTSTLAAARLDVSVAELVAERDAVRASA